jgi:putative ABC transport system permease protein
MPNWNYIVRQHLAVLRLPPEREIEIVEELALCFEAVYEDALAAGLSAAEAEARAVQGYDWRLLECELRRAEQPVASQAMRPALELIERKGGIRMESFIQDLRFGARMLMKQPGFTSIAALTLALGIGANTAIFSVLYGVLLKPLPYSDPNSLVRVWQAAPAAGLSQLGFSEAQLVRLRAGNQSFQQLGGYMLLSASLTEQNETQRVGVTLVTAGLFELLGFQPALGRTFRREDETPGSQRVVVMGYEMWQRQYGADANILGRIIRLNDTPVTVVGVMPPDFRLPEDFSYRGEIGQLWVAAHIDQANPNRGNHNMRPIARLKPDVRPEQAFAEVSSVFAQLRQDHPQDAIADQGYYIRVLPLHDDLVGSAKKALWVLVGAVGMVLLIACANVSSLLLARAAERRKEFAMRAALGAGRGRLIRQLLTESAIIALLGGAVGVTLAAWGVKLITKTTLISVPLFSQISLNVTALLFTLGVSMMAAILFGLAPAAQVSRFELNRALREEGRGLAGGAGGARIQRALVVSEVALAVMLVITAGLLLRSFDRLLRIDPGFNPKNLLTVNISLPVERYQDSQRVTAFYDRLLEQVRATPGVVSAAVTSGLPLKSDWAANMKFRIEGRSGASGVFDQSTPPDGNSHGHVYYWQVTPDYFKTMGIALRQGRALQASDDANAPPVVVINETMAHSFWPNESPLGKRIQLLLGESKKGALAEIVGVVRDVSLRQLNEETPPEAFYSQAQGQVVVGWTAITVNLVVRTIAEPLALAGAVRREAQALDSAAPVWDVSTVEQTLSQEVAQPRFNLILLGLFAVVALLLASVGIYGVLANAVRQRTHEMGVRLALGARPGAVFWLVIRQGMGLAGVGIGIGLSGAFSLTRYLESLLYEVKPTDPLTFGGVVMLLLGVALLACWIPARRATKVDPLTALRHD